MHIRVVRFGVFVLMLCLCSFCQKQDKSKDVFLKIDNFGLTSQSAAAFEELRSLYPTSTGDFFPGDRSSSSYLIAAQVISSDSKAKAFASKMKSGLDWEWRQRYFPAQKYLMQVLVNGMGFSDKEIESYYNAHVKQYQEKTTHVVIDSTVKDTTKRQITKDTIIQKPLAQVKQDVVTEMFLAKYPAPDSLFKKQDPKDTAKIDSGFIRNQYIRMIRSNLPNFFMNKSYEAQHKKKLPDSLSQWYGKGKLITPEDMNVILGWLPESQRSQYTTPAGTLELARWLLKWKLFVEDAKKSGYANSPEVKEIMDWAWKVQLAVEYVNKEIVPKAKASISVDTAMCVYALWDDRGAMTPKDTAELHGVVSRFISKAVTIKVDSCIYDMRKKHSLTFVKPDPVTGVDYKDDLAGNPATMIVRADSLRDAGTSDAAATVYDQLVKSFPFTSEGVRSNAELAKVKTEKGEYNEAIRLYRDFLILGHDKSKQCNTFFMIGFIYDEYLNKTDLAEVNYKWVLKNTPECELSDDAEFMTMHLGEPMNSVEELRAEAKRQGRKVDTASVPEVPTEKGASKK